MRWSIRHVTMTVIALSDGSPHSELRLDLISRPVVLCTQNPDLIRSLVQSLSVLKNSDWPGLDPFPVCRSAATFSKNVRVPSAKLVPVEEKRV